MLHHNFASCWMCKMATVSDRPPVKPPATKVLLELTQGHSLRGGKDKTLSLGEMHFSLFLTRENNSHHNIDFVTKSYFWNTHRLSSNSLGNHMAMAWDKKGGTGVHGGIKWMNSSLFSHAVVLLGKYLQTGVPLEIFSVPHEGEGFAFVLFRHLCYIS